MTTATSLSVDEQLDAIQRSAAIFPLDDRAFLRITGSDATRWLNGMATNNIKDLTPGEGNYNFLLNSQGRIQADCTIYREPTEAAPTYLLESDKSQIETIQQHLDKFIIMDDVELSLFEWVGFEMVGQQAFSMLGQLTRPGSDKLAETAMPSPGVIWHSPRLGAYIILPPGPLCLRFEIWSPDPAALTDLREHLMGLGAEDVTPSAIEALRILESRPKFGQDIRDKDLPQETAQDHALHFSKGCYLGQEIVERIHSRGQVHRTFTQFTLTGDMPQLPAPLEANGKPAGELTSAALIRGHILALGYIRREALTHPITYPGGTATQTPRLASNAKP